MRAIETLLGVVAMKRADGLALAMGEVPALILSGQRLSLTMPALSADMFELLLSDLLDAEQWTALRELGGVQSAYQSSTYGSYAVQARSSNDRLSLTLTSLTRGASPEAPKSPITLLASARPVPESTPTFSPPRELASKRAFGRASQEPSEPTDAEDTPTAQTSEPGALDALLEEAVARGASDVIVSAGHAPLLRVDGTLIECQGTAPRTSAAIEAYLASQLDAERQATFQSTGSVDLTLKHTDATGARVRFRANAFRHDGGVAIALRPIVPHIPSLAELNLPSSLTQLVEQRTGLVLFTGSTGSGKSTTLAALLEHINRTRAAHIVTLEDPIEYLYRPRRSIVHQREVGPHVASFAAGLRAALRENPDILLVGEMRDAETIRLTLTAALTGHLVLSTLHSSSAVMAIDRLIDGFPESEKSHVRQELAGSLRHIVAQQLVQATGGGRVPVLEILTVNHAIASQIRDGRTHLVATHLETGADDGMVPMARSLANLVRSGRITRAVALGASEQRDALERLLEERGGGRGRL